MHKNNTHMARSQYLSFIYSILRPKKHARTNKIDCFLSTSVFSLLHSSVTVFFMLVMEPHYLCLCSLKWIHWNFYETQEFLYFSLLMRESKGTRILFFKLEILSSALREEKCLKYFLITACCSRKTIYTKPEASNSKNIIKILW